MKFTPSPQQAAFFHEVETGTRSIVLEAKAGSGKSTAIIKAAERVPDLRIAALAYNAKIADELSTKMARLPNVQAMTCHSAGMRALRNAVPGLGKPDANKMKTLGEQYTRTAGRLDLDPFIKAMCATVGMAKQQGIGYAGMPNDKPTWRAMIDHHDLADDLPGMEEAQEDGDTEWVESQITKLIGWSMHMLKLSDRVVGENRHYDFDDMIYMPLKLDLRLFKNDIVFLDEAQDTNRTRRLLALRMVKTGGRLIAVGDRYQAIYGFSGADNDSLDIIQRETDAVTMPLSVTYRCPKAVVRIAQQWVPDIQAHESAPEGIYSEVDYAEIYDHVKPGDAILCRYNKYLVGTCFKLIRKGVPARIEGRAIGQGLVALARKWKTSQTDKLAERLVTYRDREVDKARKEGKDSKADQIEDKVETLLVVIEKCAEDGIRDVAGLCATITSLFDDRVVDRKDMVTLCSVHRSKGLEWLSVYVLGLYELMGRECKQEWQTAQEMHLQYVAATRALHMLVNVTGVKEEAKQHSQG